MAESSSPRPAIAAAVVILAIVCAAAYLLLRDKQPLPPRTAPTAAAPTAAAPTAAAPTAAAQPGNKPAGMVGMVAVGPVQANGMIAIRDPRLDKLPAIKPVSVPPAMPTVLVPTVSNGLPVIPKVPDIPKVPANRFVDPALRQAIERHLVTAVRFANIKHDPARLDASPPHSRAPKTELESLKLGYLQQKLRQLIDRLSVAYPKDLRTRRIKDVFSKQTIAIDTSGNQGQMRYKPKVVLAIDFSNGIAKNLNVICHELAHCSLPADEPGLLCGHGPRHTETWLWLLNVATKELGWEFVELSCPHSCEKYGICDPLRECPGCYLVGVRERECVRGGFRTYPGCKDDS